MLRLPSHLTHRLQPLDYGVFGPLKKGWDRILLTSTPTVLPQPSPNPANGEQNNNWSYTEIPSPNLTFTKTTGLLVNINSTDPLEYFSLIMTDDFFNMLCMKANKHAIELISLGLGEQPRIASWIDVTPTEMKFFLACYFIWGQLELTE